MNIPDLHDGYFDGLWVSENKRACLFFRAVDGERSTICLTGVEALNVKNIRAGNIIFDIVGVPSAALTHAHVQEAYGFAKEDAESAQKLLAKARECGLSALELNASYGAEGVFLYRAGEVVSGRSLASLD